MVQDLHVTCVSQEVSQQTAKLAKGRPVHEDVLSILHKGATDMDAHTQRMYTCIL